MYLAWREMKYYKARYILMVIIMMLMTMLVLFISGLAGGLARDNISYLERFSIEQAYMTEDSEGSIQKSHIEYDEQVDGQYIGMMQSKAIINNDETGVVVSSMTSNEQFEALEAGEVYVSTDLKETLDVGDEIEIDQSTNESNEVHKFIVKGFEEDFKHSHMNVIAMGQQDFETIYGPIYQFVLSDQDVSQLEPYTFDEMTSHIASYEAEQLPLNLMVITLFIIASIVIAVFFYIMTIQKQKQLGVLKALGRTTMELIINTLIQVMTVTIVGLMISIGLIFIFISLNDDTIPFHLNMNQYIVLTTLFLAVGLIGALISIIKVSKVDPVEAIGG